MAHPEREQSTDRSGHTVTDALREKRWPDSVSRLRDVLYWVLVDMHRWLLVGVLTGATFVLTVLVGTFGPASADQFLTQGTSLASAYIEIQTGIATVLTIVLAINQLVLNPEEGSIGRQRRRVADIITHREIVEQTVGMAASPTEPTDFLSAILDAIQQQAQHLDDAVADNDNAELRRHVSACVDDILTDTERVRMALGDEEFGSIAMVGAAMHYDTVRDTYKLHRLSQTHQNSLSAVERKAFKDVRDILEVYSIAREYFTDLYLRQTFIRFTRTLVYVGFPALLVAHYSIGIIGQNVLVGITLGIRDLLWYESAAFAVTLLPIFVLLSYITRITTVAEAASFVSPFRPGTKSRELSRDSREQVNQR